MLLGAKLRFYFREFSVCLRTGADLVSTFFLAINTLRFHLRNALGDAPAPRDERATTYQVRLGEDAAELALRTYSGDLFVFHEIFVTGCYTIPECLAGTIGSVVDLGANIGLATLFYAGVFPTARFVCVEPDPRNVGLLRRNVSSLGSRVIVVEGAARDRPGIAYFDDSGWSWGGQIMQTQGRGISVRCYTMNEIMEMTGLSTVDLLKIDIENGVEALFGSNNTWLTRIRMIIVELTAAYPIAAFTHDVTPYGLTVLPERSAYGNQMVMAARLDSTNHLRLALQ